MMDGLAAFVTSESGRLYASVCERYHVDPGAALTDGVLAHNLRVGLAAVAAKDEHDRAAFEGDDPISKTHRMEAWVKGQLRGAR